MIERKILISICALFALAISTAAAPSASAETTSTTALTCVDDPVFGLLRGEHCLVSGGGVQDHSLTEIGENVTTHATVGNEKTKNETTESTSFELKATIATIPVAINAKQVMSTDGAWLENKKDPTTGEHYVFGEGKINFTQATLTEPANCEVEQGGVKGVVETNLLEGTTKGQGDGVLFKPKVGEVFAEFKIVGASCIAAQTIKVVGSVLGTLNGATTEFQHGKVTPAEGTTGQGTLRIGSKTGPKAGIEGKVTITAGTNKFNENPGATHPIVTKTVLT